MERPISILRFQCAAKCGRCEVARLLLEALGINVNDLVIDSKTPLQVAAFEGHRNIVRLLLEPQYGCDRGGHPLLEAMGDAARGGHLKLINITKESASHHPGFYTKHSVLVEAAHHGHPNVVQMALENGADPNIGLSDTALEHPVWYAASRGYEDVVRLFPAGCGSRSRVTRLHALRIAVQRVFKSTAQFLLDDGPYDFNLDTLNKSAAFAPLTRVAEHRQAHMVHFILDHGFDLSTHGEIGEMAIKRVAVNGYETVVRTLCEAGVDVVGPTESMSPMLAALCRRHEYIMETLVELGARRINLEKIMYAEKFKDGAYPSRADGGYRVFAAFSNRMATYVVASENSIFRSET